MSEKRKDKKRRPIWFNRITRSIVVSGGVMTSIAGDKRKAHS